MLGGMRLTISVKLHFEFLLSPYRNSVRHLNALRKSDMTPASIALQSNCIVSTLEMPGGNGHVSTYFAVGLLPSHLGQTSVMSGSTSIYMSGKSFKSISSARMFFPTKTRVEGRGEKER